MSLRRGQSLAMFIDMLKSSFYIKYIHAHRTTRQNFRLVVPVEIENEGESVGTKNIIRLIFMKLIKLMQNRN